MIIGSHSIIEAKGLDIIYAAKKIFKNVMNLYK